jgi:hypothetical protein
VDIVHTALLALVCLRWRRSRRRRKNRQVRPEHIEGLGLGGTATIADVGASYATLDLVVEAIVDHGIGAA